MGKIIISQRFLKNNFLTVAYAHADKLCDELSLDKKQVANDLNNAKDMTAFIEIYHTYFGEEIKIKL
jgi:hypothetical protein